MSQTRLADGTALHASLIGKFVRVRNRARDSAKHRMPGRVIWVRNKQIGVQFFRHGKAEAVAPDLVRLWKSKNAEHGLDD